jgi:hypothetical protein
MSNLSQEERQFFADTWNRFTEPSWAFQSELRLTYKAQNFEYFVNSYETRDDVIKKLENAGMIENDLTAIFQTKKGSIIKVIHILEYVGIFNHSQELEDRNNYLATV